MLPSVSQGWFYTWLGKRLLLLRVDFIPGYISCLLFLRVDFIFYYRCCFLFLSVDFIPGYRNCLLYLKIDFISSTWSNQLSSQVSIIINLTAYFNFASVDLQELKDNSQLVHVLHFIGTCCSHCGHFLKPRGPEFNSTSPAIMRSALKTAIIKINKFIL